MSVRVSLWEDGMSVWDFTAVSMVMGGIFEVLTPGTSAHDLWKQGCHRHTQHKGVLGRPGSPQHHVTRVLVKRSPCEDGGRDWIIIDNKVLLFQPRRRWYFVIETRGDEHVSV